MDAATSIIETAILTPVFSLYTEISWYRRSLAVMVPPAEFILNKTALICLSFLALLICATTSSTTLGDVLMRSFLGESEIKPVMDISNTLSEPVPSRVNSLSGSGTALNKLILGVAQPVIKIMENNTAMK